MTPGAALLFPNHPYNVAYAKLNEKFVGANQLVVIADTGKPDGMKNVAPLTTMEEFADHMESVEGAGISVTIVDIMKQLSRLFHEGEPKWSFIPDQAEVHRGAVLPVHADVVGRATSTASCRPTCATAPSSRSSTATRTTSS